MIKVTHSGVRATLKACGPLTSREVASFYPGSRHQCVSAVISTMRSLAKQQVYIHSWTRDADHSRIYLRAVYALGNKPDCRKPAALTRAQICARWQARQGVPRGVANSVFALGGLL